ncbi:MAG: hypothetical protein H7A46_00855 [Verrucomicrobiales bacterium]|nr:hypothetical protein [Verrucomicrobiales bacterium]
MNTKRIYWVPLLLLGSALLFALNPLPYRDVVPPRVPVAPSVIDPSPVRHPSLEPQYVVAGYTYRCSECHRILPSPAETLRTLGQHKEIQLRHGLNTRCFNCHHRTNRDAFVDEFGGEIAWDEPQLLCARCHGPVYRDWEAGSHGRVNGYWDTALGPQTKRRCVECHDPHNPPFHSLSPAPAPNTLRMGVQTESHPPTTGNPLRLWPSADNPTPHP